MNAKHFIQISEGFFNDKDFELSFYEDVESAFYMYRQQTGAFHLETCYEESDNSVREMLTILEAFPVRFGSDWNVALNADEVLDNAPLSVLEKEVKKIRWNNEEEVIEILT